ncbi:MAG TPA: WhiB family transcriptional regulator [Acidimicrobiales bacterium]|nr:WhiB family transcriptional regulator [Acidimicrobiales bacterium]
MTAPVIDATRDAQLDQSLGSAIQWQDRWWAVHAKCRGKTHLFFAPAGERPEARVRREELARKYCALCPVQVPCRDEARANHEAGLWGGENEEQRAAAGFAPRAITRRAVQVAVSAGNRQATAS